MNKTTEEYHALRAVVIDLYIKEGGCDSGINKFLETLNDEDTRKALEKDLVDFKIHLNICSAFEEDLPSLYDKVMDNPHELRKETLIQFIEKMGRPRLDKEAIRSATLKKLETRLAFRTLSQYKKSKKATTIQWLKQLQDKEELNIFERHLKNLCGELDPLDKYPCESAYKEINRCQKKLGFLSN